MRRAAKIDANQGEIVKALRAVGCTVAITSAVGKGFPDLVVARHRRNWLMEVKDGRLPPSARELTPDQLIFHTHWAGQIDVVNSIDEALLLVTSPPAATVAQPLTPEPPAYALTAEPAICARSHPKPAERESAPLAPTSPEPLG